MRKYWIFNILITMLFLLVLTVLYKFSFTNQELIFLVVVGLTLRILGYLNYKINYKRRNSLESNEASQNF